MHTVTLNEAGAAALELPAGQRFLVDDVNAGEILMRRWGERAQPVAFTPVDLSSPKRVLIIRPGGFGDVLMLTPLLEQLAQSGHTIGVASWPAVGAALDGLPFVQSVPYPIHLENLLNWDAVVSLEHVVEDARGSALAAFAGALGQPCPNDPVPIYLVSKNESAWAAKEFPRKEGRVRLGVQVKASARCRTYPPGLLDKLIRRASGRGWEVHLFGEPGDWPHRCPAGVVNHTQTMPTTTFRESAALLAQCDAVLAPDSAMVQVAAALGVPTVALYGPFPGSARVGGYPTVRVLHTAPPCAPCWHHPRGGQEFPANCPSAHTGHCLALGSIGVSEIMRALKQAAGGPETANAAAS